MHAEIEGESSCSAKKWYSEIVYVFLAALLQQLPKYRRGQRVPYLK